MKRFLLVINAGSSSIKFAVYQLDSTYQLSLDADGEIDSLGTQPHFSVKQAQDKILVDCMLAVEQADDHQAASCIICSWLLEYTADGILLAVGHRVVHGGQHYSTPALIDDNVLNDLEALIPLAPLHQPHNLSAIRAFQDIMPTVPQVACFDTAFHHAQPEIAQYFALPRHFFHEGVRRYGFHGLSYEYIVSVLPTLDPKLKKARVIIAHLGSGASLCAVRNGLSVATTMGFSPLDGLVMGTRCGNLDPGVVLYLMSRLKMDVKALEQLLYHESGLLGVSGISDDMRVLLASDEPCAKEAIALFVYRISREIGSLVMTLGGLDALVFTGGIGENSAEIRAYICQQVAWLGLEIDEAANETTTPKISTVNSKISIWVVGTDENLMIARYTQQQAVLHGEKP
jgi:acetate kinase